MFRCRIDDTGVEFDSLSALAKFLGCSVAWVSWRMKNCADKSDHFDCKEYGITILPQIKHKRVQKYDPVKAKQYYDTHKEQARQWRQNNKDKVKANKEKWRKAHKEWFNAYYREKRRIAREAKKEQ